MREPRAIPSRRDALLLWALTVLFLARVLGQALVAFAGVTWLPSMDAWYSGLLPYPVLLLVQIVILLVQVTLNVHAARGTGRTQAPRPALGRVLRRVSYVYALAMLVRYVVTGTHAIPVAFHLVLASYLFMLARWMSGAGDTRLRVGARGSMLTVALCVWATAGGCAVASEVLARRLDAREAEVGVRIERGIAMMTSDGVRLVADVYRPDGREPVPAILVRIPYPKTPVTRLFATTVGRMWAGRGYAVVIQGTRGRYESGGHHYPFRDERCDGVETLQWKHGLLPAADALTWAPEERLRWT